MSKKVVISSDGMCDLPEDLKAKYDIQYFPYTIRLKGKEYRENVDLFPAQIFEQFYEDGSLPQTAASSTLEYKEYFEQFTKDGSEVVHITLGGSLSSGPSNAAAAAEELEGVHVVDSCNLSGGMGHLVLRAGRMVAEGKSAAEIAETLKKIVPHVHVSFVLDTMEFLAAGGRCPAIAAKAAGMLKCHPSIEVDNKDGSLGLSKVYRGKMEKVLRKYIADQLTAYDDIDDTDVFIIDSSGFSEEEHAAILDETKKHVDFKNVHKLETSCTCASHCGPRCFGVLFISKF